VIGSAQAQPLQAGMYETPNIREFYTLIQGLTLKNYLRQTQTTVDIPMLQ
jgi:hypothetical protein